MKYTYQRIEVKYCDFHKELNKLGNEGWLINTIIEHENYIVLYIQRSNSD